MSHEAGHDASSVAPPDPLPSRPERRLKPPPTPWAQPLEDPHGGALTGTGPAPDPAAGAERPPAGHVDGPRETGSDARTRRSGRFAAGGRGGHRPHAKQLAPRLGPHSCVEGAHAPESQAEEARLESRSGVSLSGLDNPPFPIARGARAPHERWTIRSGRRAQLARPV